MKFVKKKFEGRPSVGNSKIEALETQQKLRKTKIRLGIHYGSVGTVRRYYLIRRPSIMKAISITDSGYVKRTERSGTYRKGKYRYAT